MTIKELSDNKRYGDLYILSRFMYRIGRDLFENGVFETLEKAIINSNLLPEYTERTYDDDPIPFDLLEEMGWTSFIPNLAESSKYSAQLDEEKSLSIRAVRSIEEIWEFILATPGQDLVLSTKVDGVNSKLLYIIKYLELCLSRARTGNAFDYTKGISRCVPTKIIADIPELKVFSETFVEKSYLPTLREINPKIYKTPKSSAISMLLREHAQEHYEHMISLAFDVEGNTGAKTVEDKFKFLQNNGFTTVPYEVIKREDLPKSREEVESWVKSICNKYWEISQDLSTDGLVLAVNDLNWNETITGKYSNRNIAIKMFQWDGVRHIGKVKNIIVKQQRVEASCRIEIEPMQTYDSCSATFIQAYNPDILISEGINIGSTVEFDRDSGTINKLVYGEKLNVF